MSKWTHNKAQAHAAVFNSQSLLHYYKSILEKVSFHRQLFTKEYTKALRDLEPKEAQELMQWIRHNRLDAHLEPQQAQGTFTKTDAGRKMLRNKASKSLRGY